MSSAANDAVERPEISMEELMAGSSLIEPDVTKTELVLPLELTVNGTSVNDIVPNVPVAMPKKVSAIGLEPGRRRESKE
jgi:hypothetical protein